MFLYFNLLWICLAEEIESYELRLQVPKKLPPKPPSLSEDRGRSLSFQSMNQSPPSSQSSTSLQSPTSSQNVSPNLTQSEVGFNIFFFFFFDDFLLNLDIFENLILINLILNLFRKQRGCPKKMKKLKPNSRREC